MAIYLFNPDNDHALASFLTNYTPPRVAVEIAHDLELLPLWYAEPGSMIIAEQPVNQRYLQELQQQFDLDVTLIDWDEVKDNTEQTIHPWGWSPMLRGKLERVGVNPQQLPTKEWLEQLRYYSHRQQAVTLLNILLPTDHRLCGESRYFTTKEALQQWLNQTPTDKILKMPLSGSGRGIQNILGGITPQQEQWVTRVIREQGGVIGEQLLDKVQDFAMEFSMNSGTAQFIGYSLFDTTIGGAYTGNRIMTDSAVEQELSQYIDPALLHHVQEAILEQLPQLFPHYHGCLGIDMLICRQGNSYALQPCIEINVRMNMGIVAHRFYHRHVVHGATGTYRVDYFKETGEALAFHQQKQQTAPLVLHNQRIQSGYLALNAVTPETHYIAWVQIDKKE